MHSFTSSITALVLARDTAFIERVAKDYNLNLEELRARYIKNNELIPIYVLSDGETWSIKGKCRLTTNDDWDSWMGPWFEEHYECDEEKYLTDYVGKDYISMVGDDFEFSDACRHPVLITKAQMKAIKTGSHPGHVLHEDWEPESDLDDDDEEEEEKEEEK